ncbi:hypothetical protein WICPIJ_000606 [Wickerhamomyces pijperi]|uniref:Uncharacterized protein n=1 Tax=Wickerhamomyces pijperi TaxID=599730 RepID=A0A9P8QG74_WICPI|nr:hypothetical protein WICPIJ_000606 [Wickerhamomyces pijperi]
MISFLPKTTSKRSLIRPFRFQSTIASANSAQPLNNLAQVYVLPINKPTATSGDTTTTTEEQPELYIHFKYNEQLLNSSSTIVRYENQFITKAAKTWKNLAESDKPINKKVVNFVTKLMETIPWAENSMLTFPSQSALLKQVSTVVENTKDSKDHHNALTPVLKSIHDLEQEADSKLASKVLQIPTYFPKSLVKNPNELQSQILAITEKYEAQFNKSMLINTCLIPFTLPVALVPLIPNVPGFYLAYRIYCNYKAMLGARHLGEMIKTGELKFMESGVLDGIYQANVQHDDKILLNEKVIEDLINALDLESARPSLIKTLHQETKKLSKEE